MRIIVAGTRTFSDAALLYEKMDLFTANLRNVIVLSGHSGSTRYDNTGKKIVLGADLIGESWASSRGHTLEVYRADWIKHGKAAGPIRNQEMVDVANAAVFFWDGISPGTIDCIDRSKKRGLKTRIILY